MSVDSVARQIRELFSGLVLQPLQQFFDALSAEERTVFFVLLAIAAVLGFLLGRRRGRHGRRTRFQNRGETLVSRELGSHFGPPDYHLMNHVTIRMDDGTTQVDHVLVSRFGVYVIETKDCSGWIFGKATEPRWTHVYFGWKFDRQNPIFQNYRHVLAVQRLLDFLPPEVIHSLVVLTGDAEFKTEIPQGVLRLDELAAHLRQQRTEVMSLNRLQFCVGRLETARLAISSETDVEHLRSLERRFGTETPEL